MQSEAAKILVAGRAGLKNRGMKVSGKVVAGILALACVVACIGPALVYAEHTRMWRESSFADFEKGTAKGVAIRSDGKLAEAAKFAAYSDPNLAYLWNLRADSRGRIYGAGGSDAKVVRFDDPAKPTTVFESPELSAQTIAFDAQDNLYVGTSPDGKIYKVTADGQKSVFFEPKTKYIWALAMDAQGTLFAGTGDGGQIFAIGADGKGALFYQSDERHARSLAFDAKGNLLVGTDPDGLILRIEIARKGAGALPTAGATFVLYETEKKEVTSLAADAAGNIFAAAIGEKQRATPAATVLSGVITSTQQAPVVAQGPSTTMTLQAQTAQGLGGAAPFSFFPSTTGGSEVVKISTEGAPETLWTSREDLVFAMSLETNGNVLLGTGNKGTIVELEKNRDYAKVASTATAQVTSLLAMRDGRVLAGTANPGKVFTLGPGYEVEGSFESDTFDARIFSHWGRITWMGDGDRAAAANVAFYVRSGNTSSPEKNWSAWSGPYKNGAGETVTCPPARFVQWKVVFNNAGGGAAAENSTSRISWVDVAYQPVNVAPVLDEIAVQDPGVRVQGFAGAPTGVGTAVPVQLRIPSRPGVPVLPNFGAILPGKIDATPQGFADKGYASVLWSAHDDNDDDLVYAIYYRGESETAWHLLKDKLTQRFYSWDSTTMPDGAYYLKIVVSDSPSNPPAQALGDERVSERFEIANTPPRIEGMRADAVGADGVKVTFDAISPAVTIARAQYSVDAGEWLTIFPVGILSDAPKESYVVSLSGLAAGQHIISVQVFDRYENSTAAKFFFTVPGRAK
jgi:sugar lactone lactonase YvrE